MAENNSSFNKLYCLQLKEEKNSKIDLIVYAFGYAQFESHFAQNAFDMLQKQGMLMGALTVKQL